MHYFSLFHGDPSYHGGPAEKYAILARGGRDRFPFSHPPHPNIEDAEYHTESPPDGLVESELVDSIKLEGRLAAPMLPGA